MNIPNNAQIKELMEHEENVCLSLFMPVHQDKPQTHHDLILLKNLLHQSKELLLAQDMPHERVDNFIAPIEQMLKEDVRLHQGGATAIFATKDYHQHYILPQTTSTEVMVAPHFYIRPLLPFMHLNGQSHFFILAISQHRIRLFECSPYSVQEIKLPEDMPKSMVEALQLDSTQGETHLHSIRTNSSGRAMFHGHVPEADDRKDNILSYLRIVDRWIRSVLQHRNNPLVVAGVDYLLPLYREANSYPYLFPEGIVGNPDKSRGEDLRDRGWALVKPKFMERRERDVQRYHNLSTNNTTGFRVEDIVSYAARGLVDTLFVSEEDKFWGTYNEIYDTVEIHDERQKQDVELLNFAAEKTIAARGTVYSLPRREMPRNVPMAAIFRGKF